MDKENVIDTDNGIIFSHKKWGDLATGDNKGDLKGLMLSEISQTEKDKYHMISLFFVEYKERKFKYREQIGGCQRFGVEVDKWVKVAKGMNLQLQRNKFLTWNIQHGDYT